MKTWVVPALVFMFTSAAFADRPAGWCSAADGCSAPQSAIWTAFQNASAVVPQSMPAHFTGSCYFLSRHQDPDREAFGLAVLDGKDGGIYFRGRFAEFAAANPWENLTLDQARAAVNMSFENRFRLRLHPDFAEVNVSDTPDHVFWYWFRQDPDGRTLFLLGQADGIQRAFCRLKRQ